MSSFDQLIQTLTDTTQPSIVRSNAIAGLVAQGHSEGINFLVGALADSDSLIRREAAKALQKLNATSAIQPLLRASQTESKDLTLWAMLEAISELGTPNDLPLLESLLTVDSMLTRIEIKKSISRIQERYPDGIAATSSAETTNDQQPHVFIELTSPSAPVVPDDETLTAPKAETDTVDDTQHINDPTEVVDETEPVETTRTFTNLPDDSDERTLKDSEDVRASADAARCVDAEDTQPADVSDEVMADETETPDTASPQREDDTDIKGLSDAIARSPRLAGSSVSLPMLAPNAATVPYHPNGTALEPARTNLFLALLHPSKYLSKRWLSRTRIYLILWGMLIAAVVGFTQHQKHFRSETSPLSRIGVNADELSELVKRSLAEGDFYIQEGYYRKAISSYEFSKSVGSLPLDFYRKLGFAYFMEGQYALAIEAYELFLKAREEQATSNPFTAEAALTGVHPLTSIGKGTTQDYETYNILGAAYAKLGRVLDAEHIYEQAIRLAPKYGEAYNNLAKLYIDNYQDPLTAGLEKLKNSPRLKLAEALAYTAVTLNPDVAAYHNTLGRILSKRGQVNKAMKVLERAIDLQSDAVEPHYHLAEVALAANDRKKAAEAIRNVFKLKPAFVSLHANK